VEHETKIARLVANRRGAAEKRLELMCEAVLIKIVYVAADRVREDQISREIELVNSRLGVSRDGNIARRCRCQRGDQMIINAEGARIELQAETIVETGDYARVGIMWGQQHGSDREHCE